MKTKKLYQGAEIKNLSTSRSKTAMPGVLNILLVLLILAAGSLPANAHCDSYDGPVIQDAKQALEMNNVEVVLKWISPEQESEIISLFRKTYALRSGDQEIYEIVEKHFFETLVRLHRETENAPYTGLKPAGSTKPIILMSDQAIESNDISGLLEKMDSHISKMIREKFEKVAALEKVKDESTEKGREYVNAYVDYTHTVESIHDIIEQGILHVSHQH